MLDSPKIAAPKVEDHSNGSDSIESHSRNGEGDVRAASDLVTVIEPRPGWKVLDLGELWRYRELFFFLTWRDVKVRYKQTVLGAAWAIIQPVMMMVVFSVFLGRMAKVSSGDFPYPVFVYAGLLPWTFFATAITNAGNSVVGAQSIITKVYFPRLAIPFSSVGACMVDFVLAFGVLIVLMFYYGIPLGWTLLITPLPMLLAVLAASGFGTALAALNVAYRDFRYVIPFLVQLWMFATPSVYMKTIDDRSGADLRNASTDATPVTRAAAEDARVVDAPSLPQESTTSAKRQGEGAVPNWIQNVLVINPMTGVIAFFRACTLGSTLPWTQLGYSAAVIIAVFGIGVFYFRRVEDSFADII